MQAHTRTSGRRPERDAAPARESNASSARGLAASAVALAALFGSSFLALPSAASPGPAEASRYAVIEIGAKGLKGYTFDLDRSETDPACSQADDSYLKCLDPRILPQANVNALEEQSLPKAAAAVRDMYDKLRSDKIPPERIFIVGSSSMVKSDHKDALVAAVKATTKTDSAMDFVSVDQEASFGFEGVLGMLPSRSRKLREGQVAVIDIGSGNIKASYVSRDAGSKKVVTFGVDYGTKRATDEINQLRGDLDFPSAANKWRSTVFLPELRKQLDNNPAMGNRNRFYLIGGITWAMVNLTTPENTSKFPPIKPMVIDTFLATVSSPDQASTVCSDSRKERFKEISKVCDTFSLVNFVAGGEILKGLSDELGFVRSKKNIFFFRDALYAWPLGYVRDKVYGAEHP